MKKILSLIFRRYVPIINVPRLVRGFQGSINIAGSRGQAAGRRHWKGAKAAAIPAVLGKSGCKGIGLKAFRKPLKTMDGFRERQDGFMRVCEKLLGQSPCWHSLFSARMAAKAVTIFLFIVPHAVFATPIETLYWDTKNGAHVVLYQTMDVPMVDMTIAFAAGSAYDGDAFGLSALTTALLKQGSKGMSATQIAENLADTGAQFDSMSTKDMVALNLRTLTQPDTMQKATKLFKTIINQPDFSPTAFVREKNQQLMSIAQAQESPDEVANKLFYQALYKQHPYAHPVAGDSQHLNRLRVNQVRDFYHRFFVSKNAYIVFVGAIDKPTAERLAEELTHDLPQGKPAPSIPTAEALSEEVDIESPFPSSQTILRLGQLGITHKDANYFPLMVGNYIFGGGSLVSRLAKELREQNGLTYGVSSQFAPMPGNGPFVIGLSTQNKQKKLALDMIRASLSSFIKTGPSNEELIAAKQYLTGSFPLSLGSNSSIASMLLKISFYHLPKDYLNTYVDHINAVTAEDIQAAFQALIIPNKLLQISVGKQSS